MATVLKFLNPLSKESVYAGYSDALRQWTSSTVEKVKAYLPKNEAFHQAQELKQQITQWEGVLEDRQGAVFSSEIQQAEEFIEEATKDTQERFEAVKYRLKELEGNSPKDPEGLIYQAEMKEPLIEEKKILYKRQKKLASTLAETLGGRKYLEQRKTKLVARQTALCGKYYKDSRGKLHQAWRAFKRHGHGQGYYGAYLKLEQERVRNHKELQDIHAALLNKVVQNASEVAVKSRIQSKIQRLKAQHGEVASRAGLGISGIRWTVS
ncbi:MAG: hypothetical protein KGZ39_04170 [Simkania sp.]|nr:hypothetical protein [Simkania sp.]